MSETSSFTEILARADAGDRDAASDMLPLVYAELRALAGAYLQGERANHTLQPTALVHEAYLRLVGNDRAWRGRAHFLAAAAVSMRRVLVDHARKRMAARRGSKPTVMTICEDDAVASERDVQVLELEDLLTKLAARSERKAQLVELKFFAGMTNDEIGNALGISRSVVAEDWAFARAWLAAELRESKDSR